MKTENWQRAISNSIIFSTDYSKTLRYFQRANPMATKHIWRNRGQTYHHYKSPRSRRIFLG